MSRLAIDSKLPTVGTSIFTIISQRAREANAVNLSQGFPDMEVDPEVIDRISFHMKQGHNQYAPGDGDPSLRKSIAQLLREQYDIAVDPFQELTITSGATEALHDAFAALIKPGDEVVVLEPAYDAYVPGILLNGGRPVPVRLRDEDFTIDWEAVGRAVTEKTTAIIINNPHNPTGKLFSKQDLLQLEELAEKNDLLVISDEVYNHLIYDGSRHHSALKFPRLRNRTVAIFSFGKTFHATGWKVGYMVAPKIITDELRKIHQFVTFSVHTPTQLGIADCLTLDKVMEINQPFQERRDLLIEGLKSTKFEANPAEATYFQTIKYKAFKDASDREVVDHLIDDHALATIPLSPFYSDGHQSGQLRLCFAKKTQTLKDAIEILKKL